MLRVVGDRPQRKLMAIAAIVAVCRAQRRITEPFAGSTDAHFEFYCRGCSLLLFIADHSLSYYRQRTKIHSTIGLIYNLTAGTENTEDDWGWEEEFMDIK